MGRVNTYMGITFPILVTVNLSVRESVKDIVPVDTDSVIPKLLMLLMYIW